MTKLRINETFLSINGETSCSGLPTFFIRFQGCTAGCSFCDTKYALGKPEWDGEEKTVEEIVEEVKQSGCDRVCITGGEPLEQPEGLIDLMKELYAEGRYILLETNGLECLSVIDKAREYAYETMSSISMDLKPPSAELTDEQYKINIKNIEKLLPGDEIKCVIGDRADYDYAKKNLNIFCENVVISMQPVFGKEELAADIVKWMLEDKLFDVRFQLQIHKYIWDPDKRGV